MDNYTPVGEIRGNTNDSRIAADSDSALNGSTEVGLTRLGQVRSEKTHAIYVTAGGVALSVSLSISSYRFCCASAWFLSQRMSMYKA